MCVCVKESVCACLCMCCNMFVYITRESHVYFKHVYTEKVGIFNHFKYTKI